MPRPGEDRARRSPGQPECKTRGCHQDSIASQTHPKRMTVHRSSGDIEKSDATFAAAKLPKNTYRSAEPTASSSRAPPAESVRGVTSASAKPPISSGLRQTSAPLARRLWYETVGRSSSILGRFFSKKALGGQLGFQTAAPGRKACYRVETTGLEPATSAVQGRRSPN